VSHRAYERFLVPIRDDLSVNHFLGERQRVPGDRTVPLILQELQHFSGHIGDFHRVSFVSQNPSVHQRPETILFVLVHLVHSRFCDIFEVAGRFPVQLLQALQNADVHAEGAVEGHGPDARGRGPGEGSNQNFGKLFNAVESFFFSLDRSRRVRSLGNPPSLVEVCRRGKVGRTRKASDGIN